MNKHTPGPWIAASAPSSIVGWPVVASTGRVICNVSWAPHVSDEFKAECAANAKAIGALPDLIAVLKSLRDDPITFAGSKADYSILEDYRELILPAINAALAKAEGTQ